MLRARKLLLTAAAAATALALAGCTGGSMPGMDMGSEPAASDSQAASVNNADVMFAQMMIPHHEQAIEMSDMLLQKDGVDPRVTELATKIKDAQQPEIDQLREWLDQWGEDESPMSGMNHGGGMMSDDDMAALEAATGADAAKLFLEQMVAHHQGAIEMAQTEVDGGKNTGAIAMAQSIIDTQTDEITTMQELLASL
ncbi:DUF305 domain-containing protein [Agromyces mediolanus]|uniref:DUF305 domain-containing protein n=1 Tax=Agromyces mediolanus TaxID=41986 RepID=UPI003838B9B3